MSIFRKFPNKKVHVRFNSEKVGNLTFFMKEQIDTINALKNGQVYEAIVYYRDRFGKIKAVKLEQFPKVVLPARMFDLS